MPQKLLCYLELNDHLCDWEKERKSNEKSAEKLDCSCEQDRSLMTAVVITPFHPYSQMQLVQWSVMTNQSRVISTEWAHSLKPDSAAYLHHCKYKYISITVQLKICLAIVACFFCCVKIMSFFYKNLCIFSYICLEICVSWAILFCIVSKTGKHFFWHLWQIHVCPFYHACPVWKEKQRSIPVIHVKVQIMKNDLTNILIGKQSFGKKFILRCLHKAASS